MMDGEVVLRLPRPVGRPGFLEWKLLTELGGRADGDGVLARAEAAALLEHAGWLVERHHVLLAEREAVVTLRLGKALRAERTRNGRRAERGTPVNWAVAERAAALFPQWVVARRAADATAGGVGPGGRRLSRAEYTVVLARVLQAEKVGPQVHGLLTYLASMRAEGRRATLTSAMEALGCGYHAIQHHVVRQPGHHREASGKHAHLFVVNRGKSPYELGISAEGVALLVRVDGLVKRHAGG